MTPIASITFLLALVVLFDNSSARPNPCEGVKCLNGGRCAFPLDFPVCICQYGFGGDRCEYTVPVKLGKCPKIPSDRGTCRKQCESDFNCWDYQKCCNTFCARICVDGIYE